MSSIQDKLKEETTSVATRIGRDSLNEKALIKSPWQLSRGENNLMDEVKRLAPVMTASNSTAENHVKDHQRDNEVSFKTVQSEGEPNKDDESTRSSSPVL